MGLKLTGKTALATRASRGIGRTTAIMAAEGCDVVIVARGAEGLAAVKSGIARTSNVRVAAVAADFHYQHHRQRRRHARSEYICGVAGNAALAAFTQSLGGVSAKDGVRVVAISP
jgi:3-oxoacyl-[acyl-carrier protein] reductase